MPSRRKPTAAQIEAAEAKRAEILGKLSDGIDRLCDSDEWKKYLDVQSRFHRYSFGNTLLILCQRPAATRVASFKKWKEIDRSVNKGETGIRIWAPRSTTKPQAEPQAEEERETDEQPKSQKTLTTRFVLVPVFDVSQTSGKELPEPVKLLQGEDERGVFGKLTKVAESIGYRVQITPEVDGHPGANGLCEYGLKTLTVAGNRSKLQQTKSLAHEIGHALLHEPDADGKRDITRGQCELEAESTAYVVCQWLSLDTSDYSFGYVAGWSGGDAEKTREAIKSCGNRISGASRQILEELEAQAEADKAAELEAVQPERQAAEADLEMEMA